MSEPKRRRVFSPRFKLGVVERMEAGESVSALSRELKIKRELLYDWQRLWRRDGPRALRRQGRPSPDGGAAAGRSAAEEPGGGRAQDCRAGT
jgi:transposase-like protein